MQWVARMHSARLKVAQASDVAGAAGAFALALEPAPSAAFLEQPGAAKIAKQHANAHHTRIAGSLERLLPAKCRMRALHRGWAELPSKCGAVGPAMQPLKTTGCACVRGREAGSAARLSC